MEENKILTNQESNSGTVTSYNSAAADIERFLLANGYEMVVGTEECRSFSKPDLLGVDVCEDEIVFISDYGDCLHLPLNYYCLIGALIEYRQIGFNYKTAASL